MEPKLYLNKVVSFSELKKKKVFPGSKWSLTHLHGNGQRNIEELTALLD